MSEPTTEAPAVVLRRAALSGEGNGTELRAWLPSMSHEPWDERRNVWADSEWIAAMHPGVGLALAVILEQTASVLDSGAPGGEPVLRLARAILGEES